MRKFTSPTRNCFSVSKSPAAVCGIAVLLGLFVVFEGGVAGVADALQGMASPTRAPRPVARVDTDLPPITVNFEDLAERAGLVFPNVAGGESAKKYILETTGNGVALFDYDNDGRVDIFIPNGAAAVGDSSSPGAPSAGGSPAPSAHLYRNLGGLRFEDATARTGLTQTGWGQGACVGDYDNDSHRDLFVTYYGQSRLWRNTGGSFTDVTGPAGLTAPTRWDTGCSFFDYDLDGRLDLVVTSYLEFDRTKIPEPGAGGYCQWKGIPVMCGPRGLPFSRHRLFHNEGQGRFADVSQASGIGKTKGCYGFTVVASDIDNDNYPDLYVACDSTPSLLYHNNKDGTFEDIGLLSGAALNEDGQEQGGMGVAIADYDEDGDMDIVKTNFSDDVPNVYHNQGGGTFEDRVLRSGLGGYMQFVGWGIHLADVDHDGRRDLLMINGHVYPEADRTPEIRYRQPRLFYWHVGGGRFKDLSTNAGAAISTRLSSRGSAMGDLDDDGSLEVVVTNMGMRPSLLKNTGPHQHWLLVRLVGGATPTVNRDAIGARAEVLIGSRRLSGEVQTGTSFISQNDARLHFGLAASESYDRINVTWPGGARESFPGGKADRIVTLTQGTGSRQP
jgi:enediyne biosynthesis protein E4